MDTTSDGTGRLVIRMLGRFSLERNGRRIDDHSNRMRKVWLLLAYLICLRSSRIAPEHFVTLLRSTGGEEAADPSGRVKTMFYRARAMLDQLGENAGHELIIRKDGSYAWNTEVPLWLDVEAFDCLCGRAAAEPDPAERLTLCREALSLYEGDFLPKLSMEPWVTPIAAYYHRLFLETAERALALMTEQSLWTEAETLSRRALEIEPYSEPFYRHLMQCRIARQDCAGAVSAYESMSELLFDTFGVMPSDESRALYRHACRLLKDQGVHALPISTVREQLREPSAAQGAMLCDYDFFRMLYQVQARSLLRTGDTIHISLFTVQPRGGKPLARRSLDCAMENLQTLLASNLRQGDVVTRCSATQYIVMLPQANYENSCAVCERILRSFSRQYPHSPADVRFLVQPLEPLEPLPPADTAADGG